MIFLNIIILINLINLSISQDFYEEPISPKQYDFLLLELTWPFTFCLNINCNKIPKNFSIHGLWPNRFDKRLVTYCGDYTAGQSFEEQVEPIAQRLSEIWPALKRGDDMDFWRYQMNKHGYCFEPRKGARNYFEIALKIYHSLNLENTLTRLNYIPSNRLYNSDKFLEDLKQNYGVYPIIKCNNSQRNSPGLLKNIDFCFDKHTYNLINCEQSNKCKNSFIIPDDL